jgi:hypothetical protein
MRLLRKLACWLLGHAPIVERCGDDSVLACERCHRLFEVFVKDLYAGGERRSHRVRLVEEQPDLRVTKPPVGV